MIESWRWYGPLDKISLLEVAQTRTSGIVTALHEIPYGEIWTVGAIENRQKMIAKANLGLRWNVAESLPLHEDIKRGSGDLERLFENYRTSLRNLSTCGVRTVCYNFMPLLDWTRTNLSAPIAYGGTALRFSTPQMAAFEICMLKRKNATDDYPDEVCAEGELWFANSTEAERDLLLFSIMAGLPGAFARYSVESLRETLETFADIDTTALRANYARFLEEVMPTAEEHGVLMCVHPDDPPRNILGLPRIVTSGDDIAWIMDQQNSVSNGITLCSGSLGANPKNNVPEIARQFADRIHFTHLRNVTTEPDGSFQEASHLGGDTDMVALIKVLLEEEERRRNNGREDFEIPFRPDHGHELLNDQNRQTHPGYPIIGRMVGLAELRGVITALTHGDA